MTTLIFLVSSFLSPNPVLDVDLAHIRGLPWIVDVTRHRRVERHGMLTEGDIACQTNPGVELIILAHSCKQEYC